ncbi:hypothetical protein L332_01835 [Agrococcus pavilionensis RW1]|uniref:site-specific DNA-methyltransferase (adenine-specific) n=1 Tax=Agrococcus pavilionensis RW1 TaxID=1330458 RepID=U1MMV0_9MICO|nr:DNA methyltransferase [Agrococcus pavilionensis]ERG63196.1 hypothetical protein L332_01835 [Agrococcus pavilionensis RW1]
MSVSDAFIVGEDWIGEHYFSSDAKSQSFQARLTSLRKSWDALSADGEETSRSRLSTARSALEAALARIPDADDDGFVDGIDPTLLRAEVTHPLLRALGYSDGLAQHHLRRGPVTEVRVAGDERASLVLVEARPVDAPDALLQKDARSLLERYVDDDEQTFESVARLLSSIFLGHEAPPFALVLAGAWVLVAEQERWAEGRYLAVDVQAVLARNDTRRTGEIDRLIASIDAGSLLPSPEGTTWWRETLDESAKHTVSVSKDLREGVRHSIEIIANEVVRRRARRGLAPLPADQAQPLARQALRYIYRVLFLLYAEASPEMGVLPLGTGDYEAGYSLDRLRELILASVDDDDDGTHLHASLGVLFRLVDSGAAERDDDEIPDGLRFESLQADLFRPSATAYIDEVGLGDGQLHRVLSLLLLSREQRGKDRGFISYAELGINQLGAVYEGLMSYTGFFAIERLHEVAKDGDASKGSWVVPVERSSSIAGKDFVKAENPKTGTMEPVVHEPGSFVFRLAGRERQQSASFYTPEVLTRFTVSQALEELLDQDGTRTTAEEILQLTVCEPALGSGAFAIEAVRQLAEEYLSRRQEELDERIDPEDYPRELQRVKAHIALHQVYGVDLNATAVELAEVSLWLDTMVEGLQAPWFGLHLRRGNSLVGARRAVYSKEAITSKSWLTEAPRDVPMSSLRGDLESGALASGMAGAVHHFLLPAAGWGSTADAKEAAQLAPDAAKAVKAWRRGVTGKPSKSQLDRLQRLALRVETLWQFALRRIEIAEREIRRDIGVWGRESAGAGAVTREQIERSLFGDPASPYRRLRRVMDAWCALWFWPATQTTFTPPTLDQWINGLESLLGIHAESSARQRAQGQTSIAPPTSWSQLDDAEAIDLGYASAEGIDDALDAHPWLRVAEDIAQRQGYFHWELDFAGVFASGGFHLQVGNPPWVRPRIDLESLFAEEDPWWQLKAKVSQADLDQKRREVLASPRARQSVGEAVGETFALASFVGAATQFPTLRGVQPDLYRCFIELVWRNAAATGVSALIHSDTHFTDERAGMFRAENYHRLRRHWEFINELQLFDIHHLVHYAVSVFGSRRELIAFRNAVNMYHPDTVKRSLLHDGEGPEPGLKTPEGGWDLRPHHSRIARVTHESLAVWHGMLEDEDTPIEFTRMVYALNSTSAKVLERLADSRRVAALRLETSGGWQEKDDRSKGRFDVTWGRVEDWPDVILQGPHIHVASPFYKVPNPTMLHNQDWVSVDLEALEVDAVPVTSYRPAGDRTVYDSTYARWSGGRSSARDHYRLAWRYMAANTGARTLIPAIIPPGAAHIHGISAVGSPADARSLMQAASIATSLVGDYLVRSVPRATISSSTINRLPLIDNELLPELELRLLRLNALTEAFSDLWRMRWTEEWLASVWSGGLEYANRPLMAAGPNWRRATPFRRASDRRQALLEIDAIVAVSLGLTADEICSLYRSQFSVLFDQDRRSSYFDSAGRLVSNEVLQRWRKLGDSISEEDRTAVHPGSGIAYTNELPFVTLNREADMRKAHAHFTRLLEDRS